MSISRSWYPLLLSIAVGGTACRHRPPALATSTTTTPVASAAAARPPAPPPPPAVAASIAPLTEDELFRRKSLDQLNAEHPLADAFFDYDQDTLRDDARRLLEQDAQWLTRWPQTMVRVDGHCDERGTAEYNLALGDKRAQAVKSYLTSLGIRPDRIQTRTLGKEAPFCEGESESCWSQNRRGHFEVVQK